MTLICGFAKPPVYLARGKRAEKKRFRSMRQDIAAASTWITQKKWIALGILLLAVFSFALFVAIRWPFSEQKLVQSLQETFPATVAIQKFRRTYFPHPGCIAEGVTFRS